MLTGWLMDVPRLEASKDCDMKKKLLVLLIALASLGLVSCGGGNDVASSGATAVSAAATDSSSTSAPSTTTPTTEPKVNGQVDERTGVAPVAAQMTIAQTVAACLASKTYGGTGPLLTATTNPPNFLCMTIMLIDSNTFVYVN